MQLAEEIDYGVINENEASFRIQGSCKQEVEETMPRRETGFGGLGKRDKSNICCAPSRLTATSHSYQREIVIRGSWGNRFRSRVKFYANFYVQEVPRIRGNAVDIFFNI